MRVGGSTGTGGSRGGSIEARYAWAQEQHRLYGARLREDELVSRLLAELRAQVVTSRESMVGAGLVENCRACEEEEGGSCCGRGMEDHYDGVLLLINLMLDAVIEKEWRDQESCLFLGSAGCRLPARDHICVNYLCMKVGERISPPPWRRCASARAASWTPSSVSPTTSRSCSPSFTPMAAGTLEAEKTYEPCVCMLPRPGIGGRSRAESSPGGAAQTAGMAWMARIPVARQEPALGSPSRSPRKVVS